VEQELLNTLTAIEDKVIDVEAKAVVNKEADDQAQTDS
jgi:hypothetical protein